MKLPTGDALQILNFFRSVAAQKEQQETTRRQQASQQLQFMAKEHRQRREFVMTKMADYFKGLEEGPNKELARAKFINYYKGLADWEQEVLAPHFEQLYSPTEMKLHEFWKRRKLVDPTAVDATTDPTARAMLEFQQQDTLDDAYEIETGIKRERKKTVYLSENAWAWRDDQGRMGILSRQGTAKTEWVKNLLEKANMDFDVAMALGGDVPTAKPQVITDGKMKYNLTPTLNIMDGKKGFKREEIGRAAREGERELPRVLSDFATSYTMGEGAGLYESLKGGAPQGAALFDEFQDRLDALETVPGTEVLYSKLEPKEQAKVVKQMLKNVLGTHLAGYNVEVFDAGQFKTTWGYDSFARNKNTRIYFVPGVPYEFKNNTEEVVGYQYYDADYDSVRSATNEYLGTLAEVQARAATSKANAWSPPKGKE